MPNDYLLSRDVLKELGKVQKVSTRSQQSMEQYTSI